MKGTFPSRAHGPCWCSLRTRVPFPASWESLSQRDLLPPPHLGLVCGFPVSRLALGLGAGAALASSCAVTSRTRRVPSLPFPSPWKPGSPAGSVPGPRCLDEHGTHGAGASPGAGPGAAEEGGRAGPIPAVGVTRGRCLWCRCGTRRSGSLWMNGSPGEIPEGRRNF